MSDRAEIRRAVRRRRRALEPRAVARASEAIAGHLRGSPLLYRARRVAAFVAAGGEPDLAPLMARLPRKAWHLPVIGPPFESRLHFLPHRPGAVLSPNRFGIGEPPGPLAGATAPWALDLVLVPLVAFDAAGNRLGMGKGYYDRTFAFLRHRKQWRRPLLVGVAHAFQQVEALPSQPWDVPLDAVVTERGFQTFQGRV